MKKHHRILLIKFILLGYYFIFYYFDLPVRIYARRSHVLSWIAHASSLAAHEIGAETLHASKLKKLYVCLISWRKTRQTCVGRRPNLHPKIQQFQAN